MILFNAWRQIQLPMAELLDTAPPPEVEEEVRRTTIAALGVVGLDKCFVRKIGFRYYLELHVLTRGDMTVPEGHALSYKVENRVLAEDRRIATVLVHIEP